MSTEHDKDKIEKAYNHFKKLAEELNIEVILPKAPPLTRHQEEEITALTI